MVAGLQCACFLSLATALKHSTSPPIPSWSSLKGNILFLGTGRSGSSLVAALLDAHPKVVITNEHNALNRLYAGDFTDSHTLYTDIFDVARQQADSRTGGGNFSYVVKGQWQGKVDGNPYFIGDKKAASSTGYSYETAVAKIRSWINQTRLPLKIIHVHRNPFDNIATLVLDKYFERGHVQNAEATHAFEERVETGTAKPLIPPESMNYTKFADVLVHAHSSLSTWIDRYFKREHVVDSLKKELQKDPLAFGYPVEIVDVDTNQFLHEPVKELDKLCNRLGIECSSDYLQACVGIIRENNHFTRLYVDWGEDRICKVMEQAKRFDCLINYMTVGTPGNHLLQHPCNSQCFPGDYPCPCNPGLGPKDVCKAQT